MSVADSFCERVSTAFFKLLAAWNTGKFDTIRPFVSDSMYERFRLQSRSQHEQGYHEELGEVCLQTVEIAGASADEYFETTEVRITGSAVRQRLDLQTGHFGPSHSVQKGVAEIWTFLRRGDCKTGGAPTGLIEGNCPNCGALISMNQSARCRGCGAVFRSGEYDWVLARITQDDHFNHRPPIIVPGMDRLKKRDPEFNIVHIEDRTAVAFWRKVEADRTRDIRPLRRIAPESLWQSYQARLQKGLPDCLFHADCALAEVDLLGVLEGPNMDRAVVEVRWFGQGSGSSDRQGPCLFRTIFLMGRRSGARTDLKHCLSSLHCPSCGAPEISDLSCVCDYCGGVLNDGSLDWILLDLWPWAADEAQRLMIELRQHDPQRSASVRPLYLGTAMELSAYDRERLHEQQLTAESVARSAERHRRDVEEAVARDILWRKARAAAELCGDPCFGVTLAEQVADLLESGHGVFDSNRGSFGMGLVYENGTYYCAPVAEGIPMLPRRREELHGSKAFNSRAAFVNWLAQQQARSLENLDRATLLFHLMSAKGLP